MSDLISRQAALEALFDWEMTYDWDEHCREEHPKPAYIVSPSDEIEKLPSAQPERWIPCSRRMPKDYENVLVYFEYYRYGDYNCMFSTYGIGDYSSEYDSWFVNGESGWQKLHVFAWMPLPDPYKEEE